MDFHSLVAANLPTRATVRAGCPMPRSATTAIRSACRAAASGCSGSLATTAGVILLLVGIAQV